MDWNLVIIVLVGALALVAIGFFVDRESYKKRRAILETPPERPILDSSDTPIPTYIDAATVVSTESNALSDAERQQIASFIDSAKSVDIGYASPKFVTDPKSGWSVITDARVLVVDEVSDPRDLYSVLADAQAADQGLVVVSPALSESVVSWLVINATSGLAPCLSVCASNESEATTVASLTKGQVVTWSDLKSGYLPEGVIGECAVWVSGPHVSWIIHHRLDTPDKVNTTD